MNKKRPGYLRERYQSNNKVLIRDENKDGFVLLERTSLYRIFFIAFTFQVFVMLIFFPNIFDSLWPNAMNQIRNIVSWMALSASGTLLPIPGLSPSDYRYIGLVLSTTHDNAYVMWIGLLIITSDTLFAFFGYKFTKTLRKVFVTKTNKKDEDRVNAQFKKYGNIAMFLGAATPLPFTLMVYTAGALKLPRRGFLIAVFVGRALKYTLIALPIRLFNFDLIGYGKSLWSDLLEGQFRVMHYLAISVLVMLIAWLVLSLLKTIRKQKVEKI